MVFAGFLFMLNKHVSNLLRFYKRYNNEISETRAELKLNEGIGKSITTPYSGNHGLIDGNLRVSYNMVETDVLSPFLEATKRAM